MAAAVAMAVVMAAASAATTMAAAEPEPSHTTYYPELGIRVETVVDGLQVPWSLDWLPDGTMLFTERGGTVKMLRDGSQMPETILRVDVGGGMQEGGLLGIAVDPDFGENGYVYVYHTYDAAFFEIKNKIVRYQYDDGDGDGAAKLANGHVILDGIPGSPWHDGGRIQFGPDGMLYAATGDAIQPDLAQDPDSLAGKILRMDRDGAPPDDNPWGGLLAYSMGHRNPQGIDWDSDGVMVATEHGPSGGFMGTGHDEVNVIVGGGNYGWPNVVGSTGLYGGDAEYRNPAFHTDGSVTWAPSGSEFYDGDAIPEWRGRYMVASLFGQGLQMLSVDPASGVASHHGTLLAGEFGRLRDVQTGPDGYLYVLTSNRDGRGAPAPDDDRILRITPMYGALVRGDGSDGAGGAGVPLPPLQIMLYDGEGTEQTGPLMALLRHPGYDAAPMEFDAEHGTLQFGFERDDPPPATGSSLSIYLEKPLASPPFDVTIQDYKGGDARTAVHTVRDGGDHYILTLDVAESVRGGEIVVMAAHVVPEYGAVAVAVLAASSAAVVILAPRLMSRRAACVQRAV